MEQVTIRNETPADIDAIAEVTVAAFKTLAISHQTEHHIIAALRAADALTLSLVAEADGRIVGHIAFSPVTIADGTPGWYGLGPVSVAPAYQRQGIGGALIRAGLALLQALGARAAAVSWGIRNTTDASALRTAVIWAWRVCRKKLSLRWRSMGRCRVAKLRFTPPSIWMFLLRMERTRRQRAPDDLSTAAQQTLSQMQSLAQLYQTGYSSKTVDATIAKLVDMERSRLQAEADNLAAPLKEFETTHGMKSAEFYRQFQSGALGDDADLFEWSALYQMWLSLESKIQAIRR